MPIKKYFGGHGEDVMSDMTKRYGAKKGKSVFYATANKKGQNPESGHSGGSLEDITFHEEAATCDTVINGTTTHPIHKGYDDVVFGDFGWPEDGDEPKGAGQSSNRDNGYGIHYGAKVDYFGPDTDYRAEEINPQDYGRDYDPFPFRDMFKDQKKDTRPNLRLLEEAEYSELRTPGAVNDKAFSDSMAHGSVSYEKVPTDLPDSRGFGAQQKFRRNIEEPDEDIPKLSGRDTKKGKDIR